MGRAARRRRNRGRSFGHGRGLYGSSLAHEHLLEPRSQAAVGAVVRGDVLRSGPGAAAATGAGCATIGAGVLGNSAATAGTSAGGRLSRVLPGSASSGAVGIR